MVVFDSAAIYIDGATSLVDKLNRIDTVIDALLSTALKMAANENITSYSLDDGQTKINTVYRGTQAIYNSIKAFEQLKQIYINRLNGHSFRLMDGKNFTRNRNGRF